MAVKVIGVCTNVAIVSIDGGGMYVLLDVQAVDDTRQAQYGPVSLDTTNAALGAALRTFVKTYAETQMGIVFGAGDTVRLFYMPDIVGV